jgi:hypothetical protein
MATARRPSNLGKYERVGSDSLSNKVNPNTKMICLYFGLKSGHVHRVRKFMHIIRLYGPAVSSEFQLGMRVDRAAHWARPPCPHQS